MRKVLLLLMICVKGISSSLAENQGHSDAYIAGYIASIMVNNYQLPSNAVTVKQGVVTIDEKTIAGQDSTIILDKIYWATTKLRGVKAVFLRKVDGTVESPKNITEKNISTEQEEVVHRALPSNNLFSPLIADPRWPRFSIAYQYFVKNNLLKHGFAPNFGASFPLYILSNDNTGSKWEIGIQAGLFALMDIGSNPSALINADYFVGIPITYRSGPWSALVRAYHISSHLGDEFLLTKKGRASKRINLSYEGVDLITSYNFENIRLYGGGGYIVHRDPSYIKPLKIQAGIEYLSPNTYFNGRARPIAAIDLKLEENSAWYVGTSCKAGMQFENSYLLGHKVQLMLEGFSGRSMHGQFFKDKIRYIGIGLHAFL